jgi:hypothetical protein
MFVALLSLTLAAPAPLRLADLLREARDKNPDMYEGRLAELQRAVGSDIGVERAAEAGHADEH